VQRRGGAASADINKSNIEFGFTSQWPHSDGRPKHATQLREPREIPAQFSCAKHRHHHRSQAAVELVYDGGTTVSQRRFLGFR